MIKNKQHWSNFWKSGQLTSLPEDFRENYNGSIQSQWNRCFEQLPNNSKLLDVCCGNLAISLLAAEFSRKSNKNFELTALDAAKINTKSIIKKHPHHKENILKTNLVTDCEIENYNTLNKYNLITSQYGIEYCNWDKVANKIYSLLNKGGQLAIICHSAETDIIKKMKSEQKEYHSLIKIGQFQIIENYLNNTISYHQLITEINNVQEYYRTTYVNAPTALVKSLYIINQNILNTGEKLLKKLQKQLQSTINQYRFAYLRLRDLITVSNNIKNNPTWYHCFTQAGLALDEKKKIIDYNNIGVFYKFKK